MGSTQLVLVVRKQGLATVSAGALMRETSQGIFVVCENKGQFLVAGYHSCCLFQQEENALCLQVTFASVV